MDFLPQTRPDVLGGDPEVREAVRAAQVDPVDDADPGDPLCWPVFGDYTDMPPTFLLAGTRELIGSDAIRTAAQARSNGCDVTLVISDGMWHVPIAADGSGVPELQLAFDEMIKFLRRHLDI